MSDRSERLHKAIAGLSQMSYCKLALVEYSTWKTKHSFMSAAIHFPMQITGNAIQSTVSSLMEKIPNKATLLRISLTTFDSTDWLTDTYLVSSG